MPAVPVSYFSCAHGWWKTALVDREDAEDTPSSLLQEVRTFAAAPDVLHSTPPPE